MKMGNIEAWAMRGSKKKSFKKGGIGPAAKQAGYASPTLRHSSVRSSQLSAKAWCLFLTYIVPKLET